MRSRSPNQYASLYIARPLIFPSRMESRPSRPDYGLSLGPPTIENRSEGLPTAFTIRLMLISPCRGSLKQKKERRVPARGANAPRLALDALSRVGMGTLTQLAEAAAPAEVVPWPGSSYASLEINGPIGG